MTVQSRSTAAMSLLGAGMTLCAVSIPALAQCQAQQVAKLVAPDAAPGDGFGFDVAMDGRTAVIGARWDDHAGGVDAGSAYVFIRSGGGPWAQTAWLSGSDGRAGDRLGYVALEADTILVGAPYHDVVGGADAGAVYVFVRDGNAWAQQAKLTASDPGDNDLFGAQLAISGDTAIIGSNRDDHGAGVDAGSVYIFVRSGRTWTQQAKLTASDGAAEDCFGFGVDLAGDVAIIGAWGADSAATDAGRAYIFTRAGGVWTQRARLSASDAADADWLGYNVALAGDTALAAAILDDHAGGVDAGSVKVFQRPPGGWRDMTETASLVASNAAPGDVFGNRFDSDGSRWAAGAAHRDHPTGGPDAGAAYVFAREGGVWREVAFLTASDAGADDQFGSVAISGETVFVGATFGDHAGGVDAGSAYVYDLNCLCYPDCDTSTGVGILDIFDFLCFQNRYAQNDPYACDCDTTTGQGVCDIFDFLCFQNAYDAGCP